MKKRTGALPYILRGIPLYYSAVANRVELRPTADLPTRHSERPLIVVCCLCARASANCSQLAGPAWCQLGPHGAAWASPAHRPVRAGAHAAHRQTTEKQDQSCKFLKQTRTDCQTGNISQNFFEKTRQIILKSIFSVKIQNDTNIIEFDV